MKKVIFILGALILTCGITLAQYNESKTCQIGFKNGIKVAQIGHKNDVKIHQLGFWNFAKVCQVGAVNDAFIMQRGTDHTAIIKQFGVHNDAKIKQGRRWWLCGWCNEGLFAEVVQKGFFNEANITQYGTESEIFVEQISKKHHHGRHHGCYENNLVDLEQTWGCVKLCCKRIGGCKGNFMDVYQKGNNLKVWALQEGAYNKLYTKQYGYGHEIKAYQLGRGNKACIVQMNGCWSHK